MNLSVNDWVQKNLYINGYYEKNETDYWFKRCKEAATVFDIGANVGYFSLLAARSFKSKNATVYAFEPVTKTFNRLKENIFLNNFSNVRVFQKAVSSNNGAIKINIGNNQNWGMSSINTHEYLSGDSEIIECITLDSFCETQKIDKIDLIKIDVEGAEYRVLKGMEVVLQSAKPEILIEIIDNHLQKDSSSAIVVFDFLWSMGYKSFVIRKNRILEPITKPVSQTGLVCFKFIN
jgi:FkbM family methyltransferase